MYVAWTGVCCSAKLLVNIAIVYVVLQSQVDNVHVDNVHAVTGIQHVEW